MLAFITTLRRPKSPASTLWASLGPAAVKPDLEFKLRRPAFLRTKRRISYLDSYSPPSDPVVPSP